MTRLSHDSGDPVQSLSAALSPRDLRVLDYLAEGRSTARIACALSVSSNTARTRIRRLQRKLDVEDRAAAVGAARHLALLHGPCGSCR